MSFNFKNATKAELKQKYKQIEKEMHDLRFFTDRELYYLPKLLHDNEQILAFTSGYMSNHTWLLTLTDRRIILLNKSLVYGMEQIVIPLYKVNNITFETGLIFGTIFITDGAEEHKIKNVWKATAQIFTNKCLAAIDAAHKKDTVQNTDDPYDKLAKLGNLKERGVITEEEFQKEKKKILG